MSKMVYHHVKYKEIHGVDEVIEMPQSEHKKLHNKLRREGLCKIPSVELARISSKARIRRLSQINRPKESTFEELMIKPIAELTKKEMILLINEFKKDDLFQAIIPDDLRFVWSYILVDFLIKWKQLWILRNVDDNESVSQSCPKCKRYDWNKKQEDKI